jgi:hypothetical protein
LHGEAARMLDERGKGAEYLTLLLSPAALALCMICAGCARPPGKRVCGLSQKEKTIRLDYAESDTIESDAAGWPGGL